MILQSQAVGEYQSLSLTNIQMMDASEPLSGQLQICRSRSGQWALKAGITTLDLADIRPYWGALVSTGVDNSVSIESLSKLPFAGIIRISILRDGDWLAENTQLSLPGDLSCLIGEID